MTASDKDAPLENEAAFPPSVLVSATGDEIAQRIAARLDFEGEHAIAWKGRGVALLTGLLKALQWKRDAGELKLDFRVIRDHLHLPVLVDLYDADKSAEMPSAVRSGISAYLRSLPGFEMERGHSQCEITHDQHGYLQMHLHKVLGILDAAYGTA